ncbi:MAG TPA: urease accessory protein UreE [Opitutaceae bacterium]|nr:urease accessory protein UreE [Opitutaceae bacterium]
MLQLISSPVTDIDSTRPEIPVQVDRIQLAKRRWRGHAEDGQEFGFELAAPLKPNDTVFQTPVARYVIHQRPEPVLEVSLAVTPSAAAGIGWAVGNLHLDLSADSTRLLLPDEPAARQLLGRLAVPYQPTSAVFRPGRFVRNPCSADELGQSHRHEGPPRPDSRS